MAMFEGTEEGPLGPIRRPGEMQKQKVELPTEEEQFLEERIKAWRKFRESPAGEVTLQLADTMMREAMDQMLVPASRVSIRMATETVPGPDGPLQRNIPVVVPAEIVNESRAEARGRYAVWHQIKYEMEMLAQRLAEIRAQRKVAAEAARKASGPELVVPRKKIVTP